MENKQIARTLRLLSQLMELYDENPFKVKSMANAAFNADKLPYSIAKRSIEEIEKINGIGKSIAAKIWELIHTAQIEELNTLISQTPEGIIEMLQIKGIGPKKLKVIWKDLNIENTGELYYACNENRLIEAKGFGLKTQEEIKKILEFKMASSGQFLYAQIEEFAKDLFNQLKDIWETDLISFTGTYRRRCEIIESLDILIGLEISNAPIEKMKEWSDVQLKYVTDKRIELETLAGLKININLCPSADFYYNLVIQTGNEVHITELNERIGTQKFHVASETAFYAKAGLEFIEPELREGMDELKWAEAKNLPKLIEFTDLRGSLHNHSVWSDGVDTIEEMAVFCRDQLNLEYLGMCDHSKSAFYANGLTETRLLAQHLEIDSLNERLAPFKIFKGIESDILYDGSLDYPKEILASFDFVVASVHSILKMNEEKATERLVKAIENPYTTILGHPTGRLLLSRRGYPIDYKKVIDACAANGVIIEINSNPLRLDLDWRWHQYAINMGVLLSINPDAHRKDGFYDMHYGILVARKGGVQSSNCLNTMDLRQITNHFEQRKSEISY